MLGKHHSDETKEHWSKIRKGKNYKHKNIQIETNDKQL